MTGFLNLDLKTVREGLSINRRSSSTRVLEYETSILNSHKNMLMSNLINNQR